MSINDFGMSSHIDVPAPSLLSFNFTLGEARYCCLRNLVSLVEADIEILGAESSYSADENLEGFLGSISNVSALTLDYSVIEHENLPEDLPMFDILTYLKLLTWFTAENMNTMIYILQHTLNLKTLVI